VAGEKEEAANNLQRCSKNKKPSPVFTLPDYIYSAAGLKKYWRVIFLPYLPGLALL
jgi:hypothetical protein